MEPAAGVKLLSGRNLGPVKVFCPGLPLGRVTAALLTALMLACCTQGDERKSCLYWLWFCYWGTDASEDVWYKIVQRRQNPLLQHWQTSKWAEIFWRHSNGQSPTQRLPAAEPCGCAGPAAPPGTSPVPWRASDLSQKAEKVALCFVISLYFQLWYWYSSFTGSVINEEHIQDDKNVYLPPPFFF